MSGPLMFDLTLMLYMGQIWPVEPEETQAHGKVAGSWLQHLENVK